MRHDFGHWRGDYFELNAPESLLTDNALLRLSALNKGVRMERTADGRLIAMPPVGGTISILNAHLTTRLGQWDEAAGLGVAFASCVGFHLPNSAVRSPDLSWVRHDRWEGLTKKERERFAPLCPDFVGEIAGPPLGLPELQEKMQEYIDNGARLGWLIDPESRRVEIYRPGQEVEVLDNPTILSGEAVLPGFTLNLMEIFS
jgi:Uma2 family endonuclease